MSRLRRVAQHSRFFFITCNLAKGVRPFGRNEFEILAKSIIDVRRSAPFALCGYCFMPDHWHAILFPFESASLSGILMRIKITTYRRIRKLRLDSAPIWQSRFYDHILRTRGAFDGALQYIHQNPIARGLVDDPLDWPWSSAKWMVEATGPIDLDDIALPFDPKARM